MDLTLNGGTGLGRRPSGHEPARAAPRRARRDVGQGRLRARGLVRRLHGPRSTGKAVVSSPRRRHAVGRSGRHAGGARRRERQRWADCFVASGASQCGFCSPGHPHEGRGVPAKHADPTRDEIAACPAGEPVPLHGVREGRRRHRTRPAARRGDRSRSPSAAGRVGARAARYLGRELALGDKPYINDIRRRGVLHGALRFSTTRARSCGRSTPPAAEAHPDVVAVLTAADVPGDRVQGLITRDWRQLVAVGETTSYVGDVLAIVLAETRHAARGAAALLEVGYEVLEPVTDPFEALEPDAPALHEDGNLLSTSAIERGDVDAALDGAGTRPDRDLPDAVHRARVPRARVRARSPSPTGRSTSRRRGRASGRTADRSRRSSASTRTASA